VCVGPVDCLWDWSVPLLIDDRVDLVFSIKTISCNMVYKFKTLVIYIYILNDMCENLFLAIHTMSNQFLFKNQV
jgi:hypothetical protein